MLPRMECLLDTLQRALGLDRDLDGGVRRAHAPQSPQLLVALLVARDLDVLGVDVLAEAGDLVGAERVGAGDDATAVLDPHGHLGIGQRGAVGVLDEAEISRPFLFAVVVVVPEARAARPQGGRQYAHRANDQTRKRPAPTEETHSRPPDGSQRLPISGTRTEQVHRRSGGAPLAGGDPTATAAGISTSCVRAGRGAQRDRKSTRRTPVT